MVNPVELATMELGLDQTVLFDFPYDFSHPVRKKHQIKTVDATELNHSLGDYSGMFERGPCPLTLPVCSSVSRFYAQTHREDPDPKDSALDAIVFTVSRPIMLRAIGCFGGEDIISVVHIELRRGDSTSGPLIASTFDWYEHPFWSSRPVLFQAPILLDANQHYTVTVHYRDKPYPLNYGLVGRQIIKGHDDVAFTFSEPRDPPISTLTNVSQGQIPHLYYSLPHD